MRLVGLSAATVTARRTEFGLNTIVDREPPIRARQIFLRQLRNPLLALLLLAAGISWYLADYLDAFVIGAAIGLNLLLGFLQEFKAERSLAALKKLVTPAAWVMREGKRMQIPARDVVVGDYLLLAAGDKVAGDGQMLVSEGLQVSEAVLTGESYAITKNQREMVFAGTVVVRGRGIAEIVTIGRLTKMGQIARLVAETRAVATPLEQRLNRLSRQLSLTLGSLAVGLFFLATYQGVSLNSALVTTIALAVAVIPEGLPIMVTLMLAIGMERLARRRATIRRLAAVETLGSVTVAAVDKTGTITTGHVAVAEVLSDDPEATLRLAILASDIGLMTLGTADPLETAIGEEVSRLGFSPAVFHSQAVRRAAIPFDARKRYMATWVEASNRSVVAIKGAPEVLLKHCRLPAQRRGQIDEQISRLTQNGFRLLLVAEATARPGRIGRRQLPKTLTYRGLISFTDPVRPDAQEALSKLIVAGIRPIVITGDHPATARAIMNQLGLTVSDQELLTGEELRTLTKNDLARRLPHLRLAARILPEEKLLLVEALQELGEVVAMTGDGINDGPALKKADIGIAMGESGTEVAKEIADLILLDDSLSTIVAAVEEGRTIVRNLKKGILYLLGTNIAELILIVGATLLGWPLPLTATQILWINLVGDTLPVAGLAFETSPDALERGPTRTAARIIDGFLVRRIAVMGLVIGSASLWVFSLTASTNLQLGRTVTFTTLVFMQLVLTLSVRSLKNFRWPWQQANITLLLALVSAFFIQLFALYGLGEMLRIVPLSTADWLLIFSLGLSGFIIVELVKRLETTVTTKHT